MARGLARHRRWLVPTRAAIRGYGAGMEPGPDARLQDGWLVWQPKGAAGARTGAGGLRRDGGGLAAVRADCVTLGADVDQPVILRPIPRPCPD